MDTNIPFTFTFRAAEPVRDSEGRVVISVQNLDFFYPEKHITRATIRRALNDERMDRHTLRGICHTLNGVFCPEKKALKGVSVDIKMGEITGFIGPSGCGKSTRGCWYRAAATDTVSGHVNLEKYCLWRWTP